MPGSAEGASPDTIAAIATPPGRGGIGVLRLSGPAVAQIARAVIGELPPARHAKLCTARDCRGERLDQGIALYFPAPCSYTGEHVLEFHGHGGPVVLHALLGAFLDAGARLAEPGEYTRRAFLNGKLDLAQAEAVADLIDAASREAARSALRSLRGEFSAAIERLVARLMELRALTEAMLDFPEEDLDALHRDDARTRLASVRGALDEVLAKSRQGSLLRSGIHVVIAGRPNVGKSSLMNRLAGEERAIVTPVAGTTRDLVRDDIQIAGVPLHVVDTAGLRETSDAVERIGVERAWQELARADVVLVVFEAQVASDDEDRRILDRFRDELPPGAARIDVYNKIDLAGRRAQCSAGPPRAVWLSAKTGEGIEQLREALLAIAGWERGAESPFLARERHLRALASAREHLQLAEAREAQWELFAEELRLAQDALGAIIGRVTAEDLLGQIFARFCVGK